MRHVISAKRHLGQKGFSLLELLVAFAIMAMSLGLLYRAAGGSVRSVGDAERHEYAVALAESLMASYDVIPPEGANSSGETAGLSWQVLTEPYTPTTVTTAVKDVNTTPLHQLTVRVSWGEVTTPRQIQLVTLLPQQLPLPGAVVR